MKKFLNILNRKIHILTILLIVSIWQLAHNFSLLPKFIIPSPKEIVTAFIKYADDIFYHTSITILAALIGLFLSIIFSWLLAIMMDRWDLLNRAIYPLLVISQTIPTIAIAPILILWLGFGAAPKIVLILITTSFPLIVAILDGFKHTDKDTLNLLKTMKASYWQTLIHIKIPFAFTYFYAGLRISVSYAFIAALVSEWLGSTQGLGVYMIKAKKLFQYDTMFAIIILISVISLLAIHIVKLSEKKFLKYKYIGEKK